MNSRSKGKRGELEAAKEWVRVMGGTARRGQQFSGGQESPDVISSHETLHLEVKRCEAGNPYRWMEQAVRDAGDKTPLVLHRRNGQPWLVMVRLDDVPRLAQAISETAQDMGRPQVPPAVPGEGVPPALAENEQHAGVLAVRRRRGPGHDRPAEYSGQRVAD